MRPRSGLGIVGVAGISAGAAVVAVLALLVLSVGLHTAVGTDDDSELGATGEAAIEDSIEQLRDRPEIHLVDDGEPALGFLREGQVIVVTASGFDSNSSGRLAQCRRHGDTLSDCTNGFAVRFDDSGAARVQYAVLAPGGGTPCAPDALCVISVGAGDRILSGFLGFDGPAATPPSEPVPDAVAGPPRPSAEYDAWRLATGALVAILLCVAAATLMRRTDWREPTEASTPEMDAATVG